MKSTNKNFLYNILYQLFIFVIPLITTPYVSRVLGVNNIGVYSYTYSIINYFMLCSMLGINNYGSREIAKNSKKLEDKSRTFWSIYILQLLCTFIMVIIFFVFYSVFDYKYKNILLIQTIFLLSCAFDINWYFFGSEKFKITISRNIIIKLLSLILIFSFVKGKNDLWIYTLILSGSTLISQIYLWFYLKREIIFTKVRLKDILKHLKGSLILFIPVIAYSIYRIMDKTMIGAISDTIQLGNYESAEKIINIPISIISALGTVMLPHMSKTDDSKFNEKIISTFELCFFILFAMFFGLTVIADDFSTLFFGKGFSLVSNIIKMLLITTIFSGITNVIRNNYLIPKCLESIYVKSTIYGAIVNLCLNLIFIPKFGAYGACIGTIGAELLVMIYQIVKTKNAINYKIIIKKIIPFFIKSLIMAIIIYLIGMLFTKNIKLKLIVQILMAVIIYLGLNNKYVIYDFFGYKAKKH